MFSLKKKFFCKYHKLSYKNFPILVKIALCFIIIILLMVISCISTFYFYRNDKYKTTLNMVTQMNSQTLTQIDDYVQSISDLTKTPLFYKNSIRSLYQTNTNSYEFLNMQKDLNSIIDNIFSLNKNIHSVFIFNLKGNNYYNIQGGDLSKNYSPVNTSWFKKCINDFQNPVNIPTFEIPNSFSYNFKSPYVFSTARALFSYDDSHVAGVILINSSVDFLSSTVSKLLVYTKQRIIITDKHGYIIYDTKGTNITTKLNSNLYKNLVSPKYTYKNTTISGTSYLATKEYSKVTGWQLINIIPNSSLNKSITEMSIKITLITLLFILIACLFIFIFIRRIMNTLKKLSHVMKIVEKYNFDIKLPVKTDDELGRLSKTFNTMTSKIKELIDEVYVNKINQKELELKMLQNQINPHFIYNTLEAIHMMAEINDDKETSEMAINFGSILRYGLTNKQKVVTVKDEIDNINAYIALLKTRYDNIDEVNINIDKNLYHMKIIKLIFQPIVENAIYHGLSGLETGGVITISGHASNHNIFFEISDNGNGMDQPTVTSLNAYINDLNNDFKSIGLKNVNMRIKLYYGESYGLFISSKKNKGTVVKIIIPYI